MNPGLDRQNAVSYQNFRSAHVAVFVLSVNPCGLGVAGWGDIPCFPGQGNTCCGLEQAASHSF